jgi:hypothetical protein
VDEDNSCQPHLVLGNLEVLGELGRAEGGREAAILDHHPHGGPNIPGQARVQGRLQTQAHRVMVRNLGSDTAICYMSHILIAPGFFAMFKN